MLAAPAPAGVALAALARLWTAPLQGLLQSLWLE